MPPPPPYSPPQKRKKSIESAIERPSNTSREMSVAARQSTNAHAKTTKVRDVGEMLQPFSSMNSVLRDTSGAQTFSEDFRLWVKNNHLRLLCYFACSSNGSVPAKQIKRNAEACFADVKTLLELDDATELITCYASQWKSKSSLPIPASFLRKRKNKGDDNERERFVKRLFKFDTGNYIILAVAGIEGGSISLRAWKDFVFAYPWSEFFVVIDEQLDRRVSLPGAWVRLGHRKILAFALQDLIDAIDGQPTSPAAGSYLADMKKSFEARNALTSSKRRDRNGDRAGQFRQLELGAFRCRLCLNKYEDSAAGRVAFVQHCRGHHSDLMPSGPRCPVPGCNSRFFFERRYPQQALRCSFRKDCWRCC